jgi:hypothetical protein
VRSGGTRLTRRACLASDYTVLIGLFGLLVKLFGAG